jgi:hypothetical protein
VPPPRAGGSTTVQRNWGYRTKTLDSASLGDVRGAAYPARAPRVGGDCPRYGSFQLKRARIPGVRRPRRDIPNDDPVTHPRAVVSDRLRGGGPRSTRLERAKAETRTRATAHFCPTGGRAGKQPAETRAGPLCAPRSPVSVAVRIAVANNKLRTRVLAKVEEVRASRRRLVEAADAERRRLEHELREAVEPRLRAVAGQLEGLRPEVGEVSGELDGRLPSPVEVSAGDERLPPTSLPAGGHHRRGRTAGSVQRRLPTRQRRADTGISAAASTQQRALPSGSR